MSRELKIGQPRIVIVEDEDATREAFATAVRDSSELQLLASCATIKEGVKALKQESPDVLVTDLQLPDGHGIDLIALTRHRHPDAEIMVISIFGDEKTVVAAIEAGASGFLLKDAQQIDIVTAINDLLKGNSPISTAVARHIIRLAQLPATPSQAVENIPKVSLTERELDILWGIAKGFSYRDVATRLNLSPNTIPSYIKSIYRKLEVNSRGEAVFEAIQRGIIDLS